MLQPPPTRRVAIPASARALNAAGLVVWRHNRQGEVEVLVVHRRKRRDWVLPKGRIDRGEGAAQTARREVREETGIVATLTRYLGILDYCGRGGGCNRQAYFWLAEATGGGFTPNHEIDRVAWLPLDKAAARLSQRAEADFLRRVVLPQPQRHPPETDPLASAAAPAL